MVVVEQLVCQGAGRRYIVGAKHMLLSHQHLECCQIAPLEVISNLSAHRLSASDCQAVYN